MFDLVVGARRVRRWAVIWLAALLLLVAPTTAFAAQSIVSDPGGSSVGICETNSTVAAAQSQSEYLMINRWSSATGTLHSRLSAAVWDDIPAKVQRNLSDSSLLSLGNAEWATAVNLVEGASRFCVSDVVGTKLDQGAAALGKALNSSGLLVFCALVGLFGLLWRARREGMLWSGVGRILVTLSVFSIMVAGASNTTSAGYGAGSPGWIASKLNATVSGLSAGPAKALAALTVNTIAPFDKADTLSCGAYVDRMRAKYEESYGAGTAAYTSTVPATMDSMWAASGLPVYIKAQFGANNPYGERVFCRQLEFNARVSADRQAALTGAASPTAASTAFNPQDNNIITDRTIIAWAACVPGGSGDWTVDVQWAAAGVKAADCQTWATTDASDLNGLSFNFEDDIASVARATAAAPAVRDFVLSYHGQTDRTSSTYLFIYLLTATIMLVLFGGLALGLFAAKLAMTFVLLLAMFVALRDLFRPNEDSALLGVVKQYWGMALYAFGVGTILGLMAYMTSELSGVFDAGTLEAISWAAVCPLIVAFIIGYVLKNVFKTPHLFRPTSALKWGAAGGALGAGVGIGADRLMNRGSGLARQATRSMTRSASDKVFGVGQSGERGLGGAVRRKLGKGGSAATAGAAMTGAAAGAAAAGHRKEHKNSTEGLAASVEDALSTGRHVAPEAKADMDRAVAEGQRMIDAEERTRREAAGGFSETGSRPERMVARAANRSYGAVTRVGAKISATPERVRAAVETARANPLNTARVSARSAAGYVGRHAPHAFTKSAKVAGLTVAAMSAPVAAAPLLAAGAAVYGVRKLSRRVEATSGKPGHYSPAQLRAAQRFVAHQQAQAQASQEAMDRAQAAVEADARVLDGGDAPVIPPDEQPKLIPGRQ